MNQFSKKFKAFIGLDWANDKHDVCIQVGTNERTFHVIKHTPEALDEWLNTLHREVKGHIAISIELTKGPVVYALQKYPFVTVFPVSALTLARYRQAFNPSGAKDDPTDAELALDLMLRYPERIKPLNPSSDDIQILQHLVVQRRLQVEDKRRYVNRLINTLKQYFPQLLQWFSHRDTDLFCQFILKWPSLQKLQRAHSETIRKFFHSHGGNAVTLAEKRITAIKDAIPLTNDQCVIKPHQLLTVCLVKQLQVVIENIREYDQKIANLFELQDDAELFKSLPGTGPCLAPRLLAALGDDRSRFNTAQEIQNYAGLSPVTERSGQKSWVHWRWQCSKFIRQSFIEWSAKSVNSSYWAGIYYQSQRDKGQTHQRAVRSLAYKWARIVFKCWKDRTVYDEAKYLKVLRERKSPLMVA